MPMLIEGTATFWLDALKIFDAQSALPEWFSKEIGSQKSLVAFPIFGNIRMIVPNRWANVTITGYTVSAMGNQVLPR